MLLNAKFNDTYHKFLWPEAVHICKHMRNSMMVARSTKTPVGNFYGEKSKRMS